MDDELIRRRLEAIRIQNPDPSPGWPRQRFKVINGGHIPTAVPRVFWGVPLGPVIGASSPAEGGAIASTALTAEAQPIVVIGPEAPVVGRELLAWRINDQWVADYGDEAGAGASTGPRACCNTCSSGDRQLLWPMDLTVSGPGGGGIITGFVGTDGCRQPIWAGNARVSCIGVKLVDFTWPSGAAGSRLPDIYACCTEQPMTSINACVFVVLRCGGNSTVGYSWALSASFTACIECSGGTPIDCSAHQTIPIEASPSRINLMCGGGGSLPCGEPASQFPDFFQVSSVGQALSTDQIDSTLISCREPRPLVFSLRWPGVAGYAPITVSP